MKRTSTANRRTTALSIQRLLTLPPRTSSRASPGAPGDLLLLGHDDNAGGHRTASTLPPWVRLLVTAASTEPTCAGCGRSMEWSDWTTYAAWLPLGEGLFSATCETCRQRDAHFKDGRAT